MTSRTSTAKRRIVSASALQEAMANSLDKIRSDDRLTYDDIGRVLGKGRDAATRYCEGESAMDAITYLFAKQAWNGRFTREADALIGHAHTDDTTDHEKQSAVLEAALALAKALEDGVIKPHEIRDSRKVFEAARDAFDALLSQPLVKKA
jgi:hypothetical protein